MIRNLRFILLLMKTKISRMAVFRFSFFGAFLADGTLFVIQLLAFETIYSQVDSIGGWGRGQMIIFVGTFSLINALNMLIFFFGIVDLPGIIRRGDLDQYLTKPVNPLLRLTFENVNPGSFPLVILSVIIICYGVSVAGVQVSFAVGAGYAVLVLLMTLLWYDMELILRSVTFLFLSQNGIQELEVQALELNFKVPGVLFKGIFKVLFYFVLPYGIMSTVPTQFLTDSISASGVAAAALTAAAFTVFALWFWKFGLKHYKSAGG
jgi:ABC-2 type transport system permease protein